MRKATGDRPLPKSFQNLVNNFSLLGVSMYRKVNQVTSPANNMYQTSHIPNRERWCPALPAESSGAQSLREWSLESDASRGRCHRFALGSGSIAFDRRL